MTFLILIKKIELYIWIQRLLNRLFFDLKENHATILMVAGNSEKHLLLNIVITLFTLINSLKVLTPYPDNRGQQENGAGEIFVPAYTYSI